MHRSLGQHRKRATQKEKRLRAFAAYLAVLDTAVWMRGQMRAQLESFDLTMGGFRLLEMLYREGPMSVPAASRKQQCTGANLGATLKHLLERGWVHHEFSRLPPVRGKENHIPKAMRNRKRQGRPVGIVRLTPLGEKFIGVVFPKHAKVVKALMRLLNGREQESLSRLCGKLREGDVRKFVSEMMHEEVKD